MRSGVTRNYWLNLRDTPGWAGLEVSKSSAFGRGVLGIRIVAFVVLSRNTMAPFKPEVLRFCTFCLEHDDDGDGRGDEVFSTARRPS